MDKHTFFNKKDHQGKSAQQTKSEQNQKAQEEEDLNVPNPGKNTSNLETPVVNDGSTKPVHAKVKPMADPSTARNETERRIEELRAKTDRTLEEGLKLEELELGVRKSREINAGYTSDRVHGEQKVLRDNERKVKAANAEEDKR